MHHLTLLFALAAVAASPILVLPHPLSHAFPRTVTRRDLDPHARLQQDANNPRVEAIVLPGYANVSNSENSTVNIAVVGQAFLFTPPTDGEDVLDPYEGLFNAFRTFDLSPEQEQRLVNRSYYFKVNPYEANGAQVQLGADQSSTANLTVPSVPDIQDPQPRAFDIAQPMSDADRPPESRLAITLDDDNNDNGVVLVNHTFTNLPRDFVPDGPTIDGLGAVLLPYQVAALQNGQEPVADPQGGGASYLVMEPQRAQGGGNSSMQAQQQQDQAKHMAVLSDIDDVLKDTRVFSSIPSREALVNTYAEIYQPIPDMPELFRNTIVGSSNNSTSSDNNPALTFHYISGIPLPLAPSLLQFLHAYYPPGSLTLRPITSLDEDSFSNFLSDAFSNEFRLQAHRDVLNTFPQAQAVIFGDTTERAVETYLSVLQEYPARVRCLYLRRLQGSDLSLTVDNVMDKINEWVSEQWRERAREVVVVFDEVSELQGLDFAASPVKCK